VKIATWNINDINKRLPLLLTWLDATKQDAVALQELKATAERYPEAELERAGYGSLVVGQRTWNGVALLARGAEPVPVRRSLPSDPTDSQARYVEAAIGGVLVASLYLPNGNPYPGPKLATLALQVGLNLRLGGLPHIDDGLATQHGRGQQISARHCSPPASAPPLPAAAGWPAA